MARDNRPGLVSVVEERTPEGKILRVRDSFGETAGAKTHEFFAACADPHAEEILFDGSIRAGKTQACCKQIVAWAWRYGGRYLVARKTYPELIDSTMKIMLHGEGGLPPACPHELMRGGSLTHGYRAGERSLFLRNGAEILFRNLESVDEGRAKLRNISLNGGFIDQVEELDGEEWGELYEELMGRLSDPRGPGKMLLAANPGPTDHWVYQRFVEEEKRRLYPWTRYVHCTLYDNEQNLDAKYFASRIRTKTSNPEYFRRMVLGEWGAFGGKRFKVWDRAKHVVDPFKVEPWWEVVEAIDYGYNHPFCCLWIAIDDLERYTVIGEHFERERTIAYHARRIKEIRESLGVSSLVTWADPSIFHTKDEYHSPALQLQDAGIYPAPAQRDRIGGWDQVENLLSNEVEGVPQLRVWSTCKNLIRELPNLRYKENSDDVEKINDHASDALRYGVMSRPPAPTSPAAEEDVDRRSLYARRKLEEYQQRELHDVYTGG